MNTKRLVFSGFLCFALALAGCSSEQKKAGMPSEPSPLLITAKALFGALKPSTPPVDPRTQLTRKAVDASPVPVLFASVKTRNAFATLGQVGENQGVITWATADGIGLSFKRGVLVSTRGLGPDLMAADVTDVIRALKNGRGTALRIHDYLNGEDQIVRRSFHCSFQTKGREVLQIIGLTIPTQHIVETCQNPEISFKNHYWVTGTNRVVQSHQWVAAGLEHVFSQQLSR